MWPFSTGTFSPKNLPDLTGKVILVTGANHGIGYTTVKFLAERGAKVYLGSRNEGKGLAAVASIEKDLASARESNAIVPGKVIYHHCDIGTPRQASETAQKFIEREERLDILINNAGVLADKKFEADIIPVNHFGTFQITQALLPLLIKTAKDPKADVRIILVGSSGHNMTRARDPNLQFKNLEDYYPDCSRDWYPTFSLYCVSKLTNSLTTKALQRRVAQHNITCLVVHPGAVNTFQDRIPLGFLFAPLISLFFVSAETGAYNSCFAAASPKVKENKEYRGAYLVPVGIISAGGANQNREDLQEQLWESTIRILEEGSLDK